MSLPPGFAFSQASLQDYVDCPRRFQLRYLLRIAWPAPAAVPIAEVEAHLQRGADFHRLVHQHLLGIPEDILRESIQDDELLAWWNAYVEHRPAVPPDRYPEVSLTTPLGGYRLVAKLDLLACSPGQELVIVDWKTNLQRPPRRWLQDRLQTRVYSFVLTRSGHRFNGGQAVRPEQVEMLYWFANAPLQPERFHYGAEEHEANEGYLNGLVSEIATRAREGHMEQTDDLRRCRYCAYRALCEQDVEPGTLAEAEEAVPSDLEEAEATLLSDYDLDLEQVAEVEY